MNQSRRVAIQLPTVLAIGAAALVLASCGSSSSSSKSTSSSSGKAAGSAYGGAAAGTSTAGSTSTATTAATAATISLAGNPLGKVLVDGGSRTLYEFEKDKPGAGKSACYGACAQAWGPVLSAVTPSPSPGLKASLLGTITRTDGSHQVTYGGHPLYTFALDTTPGSTKGQGSKAFGADWYMVGPNGKKVEKPGS